MLALNACPCPQSEQQDLDFFSPRPVPGPHSSPEGPVLPPSVPTTSSPFAAPGLPASVPAPGAACLFSTELDPALAVKMEPPALGCQGVAPGDTALHHLDTLDQLLEEAKV